MKIVGCCIYYDESPTWLTAGLAALAPVCDAFVYLDGAYALYPGGLDRPSSNIECALALHETAAACNRTLLHYRPHEPYFGNEVEKRQLYVDLANSLPGVDENSWLLVFDGDNIGSKVRMSLHSALEETECLVAEYAVTQDFDPQAKLDDGDRSVLINQESNTSYVRGLYRNIPNLGYGPAHWIVSGVDPDSKEFGYLWGNPNVHQPMASAVNVSHALEFEHRRHKRLPTRLAAAKKYYDNRDSAGIESMSKQHVQNLDGDWVPLAN